MKRGLIFSKYGTLAASTRQRFVQAIPYLNRAGIEVEIQPLFDNAYLEQLFNRGKRHPFIVLDSYRKRAQALLTAGRYDFLWVHCELFPYAPGLFEGLIRYAHKPVIYDFDDAIFHQYDQHPNALVRAALGNKLQPLLRQSDLAFCGNRYLESYAQRYCRHTEIIPTTVDVTIYTPSTKPSDGKPVVGWIGSPSTWQYCLPFADMLSTLVTDNRLEVLVIGANHAADAHYPFIFRDWAETHEVADIQEMDIGIMPIPDAPWARGKCGYKLIQYMACGIPVIASPVGVNSEIVEHGVNGFLASTNEEWHAAIDQLASDPALRQRMGQAGRARVEERYSIQHYGPRMAQLIQELLVP